MMRTTVVALSAAVVLTVGCGLGGGGGGGGTVQDSGTPEPVDAGQVADAGPAVTVTEACGTLAARMCARYTACAPGLLTLYLGTEAECTASLKASCEATSALSGVTQPAQSTLSCADAWTSFSCADLTTLGSPDACRVAGTLPTGAPCRASSQCATLDCRGANSQTCGACAAKVGDGETCTSNDDCVQGLACLGSVTNRVCVVLGAQGATCSSTKPCQYGLFCHGGQCARPSGTVGSACNPAEGGACDSYRGLTCDTSNTCQPIPVSDFGQSCGYNGMGMLLCRAGTYCAASKVCVKQAGAGESCNPNVISMCKTGLACLGNKCGYAVSQACN